MTGAIKIAVAPIVTGIPATATGIPATAETTAITAETTAITAETTGESPGTVVTVMEIAGGMTGIGIPGGHVLEIGEVDAAPVPESADRCQTTTKT
eukprot:5673733-Pyramimonas_sp.AAC.1